MSISGYDHHRAAELIEEMMFRKSIRDLWKRRVLQPNSSAHPEWASELREAEDRYMAALKAHSRFVSEYFRSNSSDDKS